MVDSSIVKRVLELAKKIQQIPAPTFDERERAAFVRQQFSQLGMGDTSTDNLGNVYFRIAGQGEKPPVVVSAHLDTVFPCETDLTLSSIDEKIVGPGIGDNALGVAALFGLLWSLNVISTSSGSKSSLAGDVWLVANVREEGLGNLAGIKAVVDRFSGAGATYIILEGSSLGRIYTRGLGVRRYGISVHTEGGHSWADYGKPSAVHEIADLVVRIKSLVVPSQPRSSLNIGVISGGTSVNTVAAEAKLQLDLRSENSQTLARLADQVEDIVRMADQRGGQAIRVHQEMIGERPAGEISADHPLVKLAISCHTANGISPQLCSGSTDANEPLSRGLPAVCIGLTTGEGTHSIHEYINTKPVSQGLGILTDLVQSVQH
jgi:tripeptide aminopeptidase